MDRSLKFFTDIDTRKSNIDPNTGLSGSTYEVQVASIEYDSNAPLENTSESTTTNYNYRVINSGQSEGKFVNYLGNSTTNDYQPYTNNPEHESDIRLSNIIQWTQNGHPGLTLKPEHFTYLKDFNVYPANRLMILRRFNGAVDHNIFDMKYKPTHTMVTYYTLDQSPIKISFNEKWKDFDGNFVDVLQNVIGLKFSSIPGIGKLYNLGSGSNLGQEIMNKIGQKLGFITDGGMPYGDPNIIHEAKIRDVSGEGVSTGLESKVEIDFETTYVMKEINGVDAKAAMLDIIANVVGMGTSPERFYITGAAASKLRNLMRAFKNGDVKGIVSQLIDGIKEIITSVIDKVTETIGQVKEIIKADDIEGKKAQASAALTAIMGSVENLAGSFLKNRYSRYKWQLIGATAALSGMHTTPWHLTIGNPKYPWFSSGNMLISSISMEAGGELGYNDMFTELTVKIKVESGRSMGSNGLTSIFNAGRGRIYDTPDKIQNIEVPSDATKQVLGSPITDDEIKTQEEQAQTDTDATNEVDNTTEHALGNTGKDENLETPSESKNGYTYTVNNSGNKQWVVVTDENGNVIYTGQEALNGVPDVISLKREAKQAVGDI